MFVRFYPPSDEQAERTPLGRDEQITAKVEGQTNQKLLFRPATVYALYVAHLGSNWV